MSPYSPPGVQSTLMGGHTSDAWRSRPGSRAPPSATAMRPRSWPTGAPCPTPRCSRRRTPRRAGCTRAAPARATVWPSRCRRARRSPSRCTGACGSVRSRCPSTCASARRSAPRAPPAAPSRSTRRSTARRRTRRSPARTTSTPSPPSSTRPARPERAAPIELTYGNWLWSALGLRRRARPGPARSAGSARCRSRTSAACRSSCARAIYGTTAVVHPAFDLDAVLDELGRATLVSLVPTQLSRLLDAGLREPPRLRAVLLGGGPIPPALLERAAEAGVPVVSTYGLTEACSQVTTGGFPLFCTRVELSPAGEILVGGPTVAPGSRGDDGSCTPATSAASTRTAACGSPAARPTRSSPAGENVAPAEVEAVARGAPRRRRGGGPRATRRRVGRGGGRHGGAGCRAPSRPSTSCAPTCAGAWPRFKVPKDVGFATTLPRTPSGKLLRRLLA